MCNSSGEARHGPESGDAGDEPDLLDGELQLTLSEEGLMQDAV